MNLKSKPKLDKYYRFNSATHWIDSRIEQVTLDTRNSFAYWYAETDPQAAYGCDSIEACWKLFVQFKSQRDDAINRIAAILGQYSESTLSAATAMRLATEVIDAVPENEENK